jgi:hypothetical protein
MKKTVKTSEILSMYNILNNAKYGKMADDDKIKVWKIARKLKPVASKFDDDSKDAAEKFKDGIKDFDERLAKAQQYEQAKQQAKPTEEIMRDADYEAFIKDFKDYHELMDNAVKEFADTEVEVEFDALSEDAFGKLMASNEWTIAQVTTLGDFICE